MITRGVAAGVLVCATLEVATGQVVLPGPPRSDARMTVIGRSCVPDSGWGGMAFKIIDKLIAELPIDSTRIYVTGHSMGGAGTWHTIAQRPAFFAAAVPVCGLPDFSTAPIVKDVPIWNFHGDADRCCLPPVLFGRGEVLWNRRARRD